MSTRNAEPETVALATLDACERAVRGDDVDYSDKKNLDAQFMKNAVASIQSRVRMLKREAAALWKPGFTQMLDQCHSIRVHQMDYGEKEGVRTEKMRCMACGRWEHCCKFALSGVGPFESAMFNSDDVSLFAGNWPDFFRDYRVVCSESFVSGTKKGKLPEQDCGEYTIGATCLRKAELYYTINTMIVECLYEANLEVQEKSTGSADDHEKWFYATDEQAAKFVKKLRDLELAIADEKRAVPAWGSDASLWKQIDRARDKAAGGNDVTRVELLRRRAESMLGGEDEASEGEAADSEESEGEDEHVAGWRAPRGARRASVVIEDDDDDSEVEQAEEAKPCKQRRKRKPPAAPTRQSRRVQKLAPEFTEGPREEGVEEEDEAASEHWSLHESEAEGEPVEEPEPEPEPEAEPPRPATRAAPPNAYELAQDQRVPGGRLPARRRALYNLGALQLKLMAEGRDSDAAIVTNGIFVLQEMLARVDQLAHTAE